jgi:hypothetical protein
MVLWIEELAKRRAHQHEDIAGTGTRYYYYRWFQQLVMIPKVADSKDKHELNKSPSFMPRIHKQYRTNTNSDLSRLKLEYALSLRWTYPVCKRIFNQDANENSK